MKFSITFILSSFIIFISSCSMSPSQDFIKPNLNLNIQSSDKNKDIIIQSLLKDGALFSINFSEKDSYFLEDDIINSKLKYFCNSLIEEERKVLERNIYKNKKQLDKNVLVVFTEDFKDFAANLKNKYPQEKYSLIIKSKTFDSQIRQILDVDSSIGKYNELNELDSYIDISHSPRIRNDIASIYFVTNYDIGKTIVPIFRSYAIDIDYYSSTIIFHETNSIKKLVDFENTFVPITERMLENISNKQSSKIKDEIENTLLKDFLTAEKIYQNNLFRKNIVPDSGNEKIRRNSCIERNLDLWEVSTSRITN